MKAIKGLIFGQPGIGKSKLILDLESQDTLLISIPSPHRIEFTGLQKSAKTGEEVKGLFSKLSTLPPYIKVVFIDSLDALGRIIWTECYREFGDKYELWTSYQDRMRTLLYLLVDLEDIQVWMTCSSSQNEEKTLLHLDKESVARDVVDLFDIILSLSHSLDHPGTLLLRGSSSYCSSLLKDNTGSFDKDSLIWTSNRGSLYPFIDAIQKDIEITRLRNKQSEG